MRTRTAEWLIVAILVASPVPARELFWASIDVDARVENDGRLRVVETQEMVLSGDWNGGERRFRVGPDQRLTVERIVRIDPSTGAETPLVRGDLDRVDRWNYAGAHTVRWRSRLPSDPPFAASRLTYRLELVYERVLVGAGERVYRLDHDFAFADRPGPIERFRFRLALAPGWEAVGAAPPAADFGPLAPGRGYVVRASFRATGERRPGSVAPRIGRALWRWLLPSALAAGTLVAGVLWYRRDRALGRFAPPLAADLIDDDWLTDRIFSLRPELVGAAWDHTIGSAEVAALLARLEHEGKIVSRIERRRSWFGRDVLHLELLVPRSELAGEERKLVAGFFPLGDRTDSERLRKHYRATGFDPADKIRRGLEQRVRRLAGFADDAAMPKRAPTVALLAAGAALCALGWVTGTAEVPPPVFLVGLVVGSLPGFGTALFDRRRLGWPRVGLTGLFVSSSIALFLVSVAAGVASMPMVALVGVVLFALGFERSRFNLLAIPDSPTAIARRREFIAARRYFVRELREASPRLEDRMFPWIVALGLAPAAERWARRFGGERIDAGIADSGGAARSSAAARTVSGWSGGGGSFGGAGATGAWVAAVSSLAAGVPSPSSSGAGSSGGGGGGGSSSGGGGGGGW